jgi:hypothetical protein
MNWYFIFNLTQILISTKFEKEIVFESSVLAWTRIRNWFRIEQKCWNWIRIKSIRIHNPGRIRPLKKKTGYGPGS